MGKDFQLASRIIGAGDYCFVIAEAGVNHNGRLDWALQLAEAAKAAGADAVKFQTFRSNALVTAEAPRAAYQARNTGSEGSQRALLEQLELSDADHLRIQSHCREIGVQFLSTPFDEESADFLDRIGVPAFKVSSGDLTTLPLLARIAQKRRPVILSTGMAVLGEVEAALDCLRRHGDPPVALLQCVSQYPADPAAANLRAMGTLRAAFGVPVGFSDHTPGCVVAWAAAALGASLVEKHLTLDRNLPGPDHAASLEPGEFSDLVRGIRTVTSALGTGVKRPSAGETDVAVAARRSLVVRRDLEKGAVLDEASVCLKRPGTGLSWELWPHLNGRRMRVRAEAGTLLTLDMLE